MLSLFLIAVNELDLMIIEYATINLFDGKILVRSESGFLPEALESPLTKFCFLDGIYIFALKNGGVRYLWSIILFYIIF